MSVVRNDVTEICDASVGQCFGSFERWALEIEGGANLRGETRCFFHDRYFTQAGCGMQSGVRISGVTLTILDLRPILASGCSSQ